MTRKTRAALAVAIALFALFAGWKSTPAGAEPPACLLAVSNAFTSPDHVHGTAAIICNRKVHLIHVYAWLTKYGDQRGETSSDICPADDRCSTTARALKTEGLWHVWGDGYVVYGPERDRKRLNFSVRRSYECVYIAVRSTCSGSLRRGGVPPA